MAEENPSVTRFREYLRIKTDEPNPNYAGAIEFLKRNAVEIGLPYTTVEPVKGYPIIYMTWEGNEPSLPSVVLNSHTDVVPIYPEFWEVDAWQAIKKGNGDIYGRGTQDMKSCGMQHLEAIRRLKADGRRFKRTIHLLFVPDEECGSAKGMKPFILTENFKSLNIGFVLDEGLANPTEEMTVFYGERSPWWIRVTCPGNPGHGSRFLQNTAAEKLRKVVNKFLDYRAEQEKKMTDKCLEIGEVVTVNLTMLEAGIAYNVVPAEMHAGFDIRIPPSLDMPVFEKQLNEWIAECGEGITYEFVQKTTVQEVTSTAADDPWWAAFSGGLGDAGVAFKTSIFPAATDSRFLRGEGLPCIGFSPMNHTPILLHDHNERLNEAVFLRGIDIFCTLLPRLADLPAAAQ